MATIKASRWRDRNRVWSAIRGLHDENERAA
jgi:hypothetical protein